MSTDKPKLTSPWKISQQPKPEPSLLIHKTVHLTISVPKTIYRIYKHPLIGFSDDELSTLVDNAHDLNLETIPLVDLNRFETVKARIDGCRSVFTDYKEVAKHRGCSLDVLINSAIAEWMDVWYRDGRPKTFQEICKRLAIDFFMNSAEDEMLYHYFLGVFGPPANLGDDNSSSEGASPKWLLELKRKYKDA
jgi:hypothetical protein